MTGIDNTVSRRAFIGTVGAAGAALAIAGAADAAKADEASWDEERDVVVVGLGGAGAAAAVCALDGGCSVCVIERAGRGGGATLRSGGIVYMGGGTGLQKALGVEDTPEDMATYVHAMVGNTDEALLETYLSRSTWLYDWLVSQGVEFNGTLDDVSHSTEPPEGVSLHYTGNERCPEFAAIAKPAPRGHATTEKSFGLFEPLETKVDTQATVHYNTTATELVCDEDGSVVGVACTDADGNPLRVKAAKGVVLCTGAYTLNDAMLADYCSETLGCGKRTSGEFDMGDGIRMGQKVGAATSSMNRVNFNRSIYNYGDLAAGALLDEWGHRYMAEDWHGGRVGLAIASHSPAKGFIILDSDTLALAQQTPYGQYLESTASADTLEELFEQIDMPVENSLEAIERYNGFCADGEDRDFHKSVEYLRPVVTAPFHAIDGSISSCGFHTLGGLKINTDAQVIDLDGKPIVGLYAAGRTSCGHFGKYAGSGSSIADALTFGCIAGESVSKL